MRLLFVALGKFGTIMEKLCAEQGMKSFTADTTEDAIDLAVVYEYDFILIGPEGLGLIREIRQKNVKSHIVAIADTIQERLDAINHGANDTWFTTIDPREVVARLFGAQRHARGGESMFKFGPFVINYDANTVESNGRRIHLTGKEYQLLELLSKRKGQLVTKEMCLNHLYGGMDEPELKIIDVFITKLRKKLSVASGGDHYIATVWGKGYKLDPNNPTPV